MRLDTIISKLDVSDAHSIGRKKSVLIPLVAYKFILFFFIFLLIWLVPSFNVQKHGTSFHWPPGPVTLESYFGTWDSASYLYLATEGYKKGSFCCAFYPLWPMVIRLCDRILPGHQVLFGLLLANIFSLIGLYVLYRFVSESYGSLIADRSLILILAFPGAIFFNFIYTESLFLLLIAIFFYFLFKRNYWLACIFGFFLPLTRAIGILCIIPAIWHALDQMRQTCRLASGKKLIHLLFYRENDSSGFCFAPVIAIGLGIISYFSFMYCAVGSPWEGFAAQKNFANSPSIANIFNLPGFFKAMANIGPSHDMVNSIFDRYFFLLFLLLLPSIWRLDKTLFVFALISGLVPAMSNWFFSYTRFLTLCFPFFIALGDRLKTSRMVFWYVVGMAGSIQIVFLIRHINFYWAG